MNENPKVSVLIPTKNRASVLPTMLDSLLNQTYKNFEVVIVDGGSTDGTKKVVDDYAKKMEVKFVVKEGGLIKQENEGIKIATGEIVVRSDDDAKAPPEWVGAIVETFKMGDDVGGATGPTITPDKKTRDLFLFQEKMQKGNLFWRLLGGFYYGFIMEGRIEDIGKFTKSGAFTMGSNYPHALSLAVPVEVDAHDCCTLAVRKNLLEKLGGFDEIYGGVGDFNEADLSLRLRKLGYKILLNPKARIEHLTSKGGVFSARANSYGRILNFINFYFRHIKPNTFSKAAHFLAYILWQNGYYTFMFLRQPRIGFLGCWPASVVGIAKNIAKPASWRGGMFK